MFEQDTEETAVIFRMWEKQVTAIFPEIPHNEYAGWYVCYAHIGQHDACDFRFTSKGRLATPEEYESLKRELESEPFGYKLRIYKKVTSKHRKAYNKQINDWRALRQRSQNNG